MTLPLDLDVLRRSYDYLNVTEPFRRWNLPDAEDITFTVANDRNHHGWLTTKRRRKPRLTISAAAVGQTLSLMATMAHEMIHLHQYLTGMPLTHGSAFDKLKAEVCRRHGFDPKAF